MNGNGQTIPLGMLPAGIQIKREDHFQFPSELEAALKRAREQSGGRFAIAVFSADEQADSVNLFFSRGPNWSDRAFVTAYQLFVGEFLKVSPERLNDIKRQQLEAVGEYPLPQTTAGPAAPPQASL